MPNPVQEFLETCTTDRLLEMLEFHTRQLEKTQEEVQPTGLSQEDFKEQSYDRWKKRFASNMMTKSIACELQARRRLQHGLAFSFSCDNPEQEGVNTHA
jgi:hypothetical protein